MARGSWLLAATLVGLASAMSRTAPGQQPSVQTCPLVQPWTRSGVILSPRTVSAVFQTLESKWAVDSLGVRRELETFLARRPNLSSTLRSAASRCPQGGCRCPTPPRIAQTAQSVYSVPLDVSYRVDSTGTSAATALFLSRHGQFLRGLYASRTRAAITRR